MFMEIFMKPVKIRIVSITKDNNGEQQTEHISFGQLYEKNGKCYAMYEESAVTGMEGARTTLKWDDERLVILRSGSLDHRQEFCRGLVDKSVYKTPYMDIPLETATTYYYSYFRGGVWHIDLEYTLSHGYDPYGEMKIMIEIEEDKKGGH